MAARFTLASGLTSNKYCNYIASFSVRSLSTLALLTITITMCFVYSSSGPNYLTYNMDAFLFAQNKTHLLSTAKYDCLYCERPPIQGFTQEQLFDACLDPGVVPEYYLSIVISTRPSEYTAEYRSQLQNTIDSTFLLAENTKTLLELILVDWNPQSQRRNLRDIYRFRRSDYLTYRIITVPRQLHESLYQPDRASVYKFEARNVGIRFARGEYILCTNYDNVWSPNMQNAIKSRSWRKGMFYTQSTSSANNDDSLSSAVEISVFATDIELQHVCDHHDSYSNGGFKMAKVMEMHTSNFLQVTRDAADFTLADRETWKLTHGYRETGATSWIDKELLLTAAWTLDIPIAHQNHLIFACHQRPQQTTNMYDVDNIDNAGVDLDGLLAKKATYMNNGDQWGLQGRHLYREGVGCEVFRGGLGM